MKTLKYILPVITLLIFSACDSNDDGFYNTKYIESANLVTIETEPSYNVNDFLYVNAEIPNLLNEPGQTTLLNIMETTNAESIVFSYVLERQIGSEWELFDASANFQLTQGDVNLGSFLQAFAQYDAGEDAYLFRGGILLQQTGQYRLSFGFNSTDATKVEMVSASQGNNIILNINSTTSNLDGQGYYNFTVN